MKRLVLSVMILCASTLGLSVAGCGKGVNKWQKQILAEDNPDQRREAVLELMDKRLGKSDGAVRLCAQLAERDEDPTVRSAAVQALGETDNQLAVPALARVLDNEADAQVRRDAAVSLGKVRGPEAVRALLSRLREDRADEVRTACGRSLGEYPYPGVVQALVAALLSEDFSTTFAAQRSLEKLTGKSFESSRAWQEWLDKTGEPFATSGVSSEAAE